MTSFFAAATGVATDQPGHQVFGIRHSRSKNRKLRNNCGLTWEKNEGVPRGFKIVMNKMIIANLVHRPIRSIISIVAVAIEVTMILLIVGFRWEF